MKPRRAYCSVESPKKGINRWGNPYSTTRNCGVLGNPTSLTVLNEALWSFLELHLVRNYFINIYLSNVLLKIVQMSFKSKTMTRQIIVLSLILTYMRLDIIFYFAIIRFSRKFAIDCI